MTWKAKLYTPLPLELLWRYRRRPPAALDWIRAANAALIMRSYPGAARWRVWLRLIAWPVRVAEEIVRYSLKYGGPTRRALGRGLRGQAVDMWRLAVANGCLPFQYYKWGLAIHGGGPALFRCYPNLPVFNVIRGCAARLPQRIVRNPNDKAAFERHCRAHDLPHARTLFVASAAGAFDLDGRPWRDPLPDRDLFVKPNRANQGKGAELWRSTGTGCFRSGDGAESDAATLISRLVTSASDRSGDLLIQIRLANHPDLTAAAGATVATTRIVTILDGDGRPQVGQGFFRCAVESDRIVDNYHSGGLRFALDPATGRLSAGQLESFAERPVFFDRHPVTGYRFAGEPPFGWSAMRDLALRAHATLADSVVLGWDMACTPTGPVIVEATMIPGTVFGEFAGSPLCAYLAIHARRLVEESEPASSRYRVGADLPGAKAFTTT